MITTSGVVTDTAVTGPFYRRMQQESPSNPVLPNFQFSGSPQMTLPATPAFIFGANDTVDYTIGGGSGVRLVIRQRTPDALMMEAVANSNTFYSPGRCFDLDRLSNRYNDSIISVYSGSTGGSGLVVLRRFTLLRENGKLYLPQAIAIYSNRSWNGFFQFGCSSSKAVWGGVFNDYAAIRSSLVANDTLLLQLKQTVLIQ
ncbi:MAG: hypothetical protein EOO16_14400 [Chitinophagaceae bacterium]|nr:MAG: hypothetical protein EOO16_14400 [Chitinophagaceae bacterium]